MYMIRGSWDLLHLYCGCHGELKELKVETTGKGLCYVCKEESEGIKCRTQVSVDEFDEILSYISNLIIEAELGGEVADLTYRTWKTKKGIQCRILLYQKDRINVMVDIPKRR